MKSRTILILVVLAVLLGGFLYIIFTNRPIDIINSENAQTENSNNELPVNKDEVNAEDLASPGVYTMTEVASHGTEADCWTAINGSVYDLTSWVSRHPGGPAFITNLCGTDGSAAFTKKHGEAPKPVKALFLLKIGELK